MDGDKQFEHSKRQQKQNFNSSSHVGHVGQTRSPNLPIDTIVRETYQNNTENNSVDAHFTQT